MSISPAHQKAIDSLKILDIYVKGLNAQYVNDFSPKYCDFLDELETETRHNIKGYYTLQLAKDKSIIQISIDLAMRLVRPNPDTPDEPVVCALIEADYIAEYAMATPLKEDSLNEFAMKNASYHVWPFWRELLASQCTRMQLPKIMLPLHQFATNSELALKAKPTAKTKS